MQVIVQRVEHSPSAHLDMEADAIAFEVQRLEGLGATLVDRKKG